MFSDPLRLAIGVVFIVVGGLYPLAAAYRMNRRLGRPDGPTGGMLVWWLAFTLSFPFALALSGVGLILPRVAARTPFLVIVGSLWTIAALSGLAYLVIHLRGKRGSYR